MVYLKLIFSCFTFINMLPHTGFSQNLALNKSYDFSVKPNYPYTAPASDTTSLTDGVFTSNGVFWTQPTTVGWKLEDVSITIDLKKVQPIESVKFSTIRASESGVFYPKNIFVFFSEDKINWIYIGDAADVVDNLPGPNQRKKFSIDKINQSSRFVRITAIRQRNFLFCDEIEIFKGQKLNSKKSPFLKQDSMEKVIDSLQLPENNRRGILRQSNSLDTLMKGKILKSNFNSPNTTFDLQNYKSEIGQQNAAYLKAKFNEPYLLEKYNPWANLDEFRMPLSGSNVLNFTFLLQVGNVSYGSFLLTNLNSKKEQFYFKTSGNSKHSIVLYAVPFVSVSFYNSTPDPMVKVIDPISIDPGQSQMFIFRLTGIEKGQTQGVISISSIDKSSEIDYTLDISNELVTKNVESLNANVWAYFIVPMVKDHIDAATKDLEEHHINTFVIPPTILPKINDTDFITFTTYLQNIKGAENILLYMDYTLPGRRNNYRNGQFMSTEWKIYFKEWYNKVVDVIIKNIGPNTKIYLYPYDEIAALDIPDFKRFVQWSQKDNPAIKFYATLNDQIAIDSILPIVDIAQVLPSLTSKLPNHHAEIWIYTAFTPSRDLSPYGFYRLISWDAYVNGYNGIGFWNYADERNGNNLNLIIDKYLNLAGSYSVIYNDTAGNIISSRRWEAFRLGIEDYSILQAYAKKFGAKKTKEFAVQVVNNPNDVDLADSIRNKMVKDLEE